MFNARFMQQELDKWVSIAPEDRDAYDHYCVEVSSLHKSLFSATSMNAVTLLARIQ